MADREKLVGVRDAQPRVSLSEAEVAQLLQEAVQQYEESMRIADLADISDKWEHNSPKYARNNPIGLVVTGSTKAEIVRFTIGTKRNCSGLTRESYCCVINGKSKQDCSAI